MLRCRISLVSTFSHLSKCLTALSLHPSEGQLLVVPVPALPPWRVGARPGWGSNSREVSHCTGVTGVEMQMGGAVI